MKVNFILLSLVAAGFLPSFAHADTSAFSYEHNYRLHNRFHTDKVYLDYAFTKGLYLGLGANLINKKKDTYDDVVATSTMLDIAYTYKIDDHISVTPSIEGKFYTGTNNSYDFNGEIDDTGKAGSRYIPALQFNYTLNDMLSSYVKYGYDVRRYSHSAGSTSTDNHHRSVYQAGFDFYPVVGLDIGYRYTYKDGNFTMYDNRKSDYEQLMQVSYQIDRNWQPYVGFEDLASSTTSDTRELRLTTGVSYFF